MAATITVRVNPKDFSRGVKYARALGGRYNAADKTWAIDAERPEVGALGAYGLLRVESAPVAPAATPVAASVAAAPSVPATEPVDEAAVEAFVAQAAAAPREMVAPVIARMEAMMHTSERPRGPRGLVNLATMAETVRRLRTLTD